MTVRKGTITGTGAGAAASVIGDTPIITGRNISIRLDFGSGSIDLEPLMSDAAAAERWIKSPDATAITADYDKVYDAGVTSTVRLNCTSWVSNIAFTLTSTD